MAISRVISYTDFSGGDWGLLGPDKAPANSFHGSNVILRASGMIGPRPGLKNITPADMPVGRLRMLVESAVPHRVCVFVIYDQAYYADFEDTGTTPVTSFATGLTPESTPLVAKPDTATFLVAVPGTDPASGVWRLRPANGDGYQLDGVPAATNLEIYDSQLILVEDSDRPRLLGSAPTEDGETYDFSAGMFQLIGDNWGITSLFTQNNYLVVLKRNSIHRLSGIFGEDSMVVRQISAGVTTFRPWHSVRDEEDRIWFLKLFRNVPTTFNGATPTTLGQYDHLAPYEDEDGDTPLTQGMLAISGEMTPGSVLAVKGGAANRGVINHNGVTTFHQFETQVSGMVTGLNNHLVLTDGGDDAFAAKIYGMFLDYERPAFVSDERVGVGDNSDTPLDAEFTLPNYISDQGKGSGKGLRVRSVTLEVKKFNIGVPNNTVSVTVKTLMRPGSAGDVSNPTQDWVQAGNLSDTSGTYDRIIFGFEAAVGQGYSLRIHNIVGLDIKSVQVFVEDMNEQPRLS